MNGIHTALEGRVARDPEFKYTATGTALLAFSLAVRDDKRGDEEATEWVRVACWGEQAKAIAERIRKGDLVYVEGRLRLRSWQQDGAERSGLEVSAWEVKPLGQIGKRAARAARPTGWRPAEAAGAFGDGI